VRRAQKVGPFLLPPRLVDGLGLKGSPSEYYQIHPKVVRPPYEALQLRFGIAIWFRFYQLRHRVTSGLCTFYTKGAVFDAQSAELGLAGV